jgi:uncharacterized protein (TIGR00299 family) protein
MKALLFDPCNGAAGDMIMGCLLDLGASVDTVRETVESVGCSLEISREERGHIMAARAKVISDRRYQSLRDAVSILHGSSLQGEAQEKALRALDILASAESRVHGLPKEEARFHEIGALDALADIAGSCAALQSLGVERVLSRPISVGGGFVQSEHGLLPVPGPAALEILRAHEIPWKGGPVQAELLTPTGAALLAALVYEFLPDFPLLKAVRVGYGAGGRELSLPNVLRGLIAEMVPGQKTQEQDHAHQSNCVVQLETNLDDVTGEVLGHLMDQLMEAGALDASILPALMKKGRSGNVIRAIARHEDAEKISKIIIKETGSLGVRVFPSLHRFVAEREAGTVEVEINHTVYRVAVKVSRMDGNLLNVKAEYEDCLRIAAATGLPLRKIIQKVEEEGWRAADL